MKKETETWLKYSQENLDSAKLLLDNKYYYTSLQNVQQSVEKALKAILIEYEIGLKRTHDILELKNILANHGISINLSDDECDLLNSIYLPSKYPIDEIIDDFEPNPDLCQSTIEIAEKVLQDLIEHLHDDES